MILARPRLLPQQRFDLEDLNALLAASRTDAKLYTKQFLSDSNYILKGFAVTGLGLKAATVNMANATLIIPQNSSDFSWYTAAPAEANVVIPDADLIDGARNYVEIELLTENNTPLTKAFWDQEANSGDGQEFNQLVDTITDLTVNFVVSTGGFSGSVNRLPLCIMDVDGSGNIKSILDRRVMFFRLNKPTDLDNVFTWGSQEEPAYSLVMTGGSGTFIAGETITVGTETAEVVTGGTTSITFREPTGINFFPGDTVIGGTSGASRTISTVSESFTGADKDIGDEREALSAIMTEIKRLKGTRFWHQVQENSLTGISTIFNSVLVGITAGARYSWTGTALVITDDDGTPAGADQIAKIRLFGKNQQLCLTREDGTGGSSTVAIADGQILYVKLPATGDRDYSGSGSGDTNYQVAAYASFVLSDSNYWIAYREGGKLYVNGYGELQSGETAEIGDPISSQLLTFIGAVNETDSDPAYVSPQIVTQGVSLVAAISELDAELDSHQSASSGVHGVVGAVVGTSDSQTLSSKKLVDASTEIVDSVDATKKIMFDAVGNTGTKTTITSSQTADRVITLPDLTDTLVGKLTVDQGSGRLKNKDLEASTLNIVDPTDATKKIGFTASGNTTAKKTTIASVATLDRTLTLPDATDTLVGKDTVDTLTNKILAFLRTSVANDAASTGSNATVASITTGVVRLTNASLVSVSGIPAGVAGQFLVVENQTGVTVNVNNDEATATAANRIYTGTGGNVAMPNNSTFMFTYDATAQRWMLTGGSGSGSGSSGVNYITGGNAESGTTGWAVYKDAAGAAPVDGTGGSPTISNLSTSTSSPLLNNASFLAAKVASNKQGEGWSFDFTVDRAYLGRVLGISFEYEISAGTFADADLTVYIYDVTNGVIIQPAAYQVLNQAVPGKFISTFQCAINSTSYRLILHIASTSASAWTVKLDDVIVGPQKVVYGPPITSAKLYTLTVGASTTAPTFGTPTANIAAWWRVGDHMMIDYTLTAPAGSAGTGTYLFPIPGGYTIDSSKTVISTSAQEGNVGSANCHSNNGSELVGTGYVKAYNTTNLAIVIGNATIAPSYLSATNWSAGNNITYTFTARVPIVGWSSGVEMSSDSDTRVVAAKAGLTSNLAVTVDTPFKYDTIVFDTHGAYSASTGLYTVKVPGFYVVAITGLQVVGAPANLYLAVNGVNKTYFSGFRNGEIASGCAFVYCIAGDTIAIQPDATQTFTGSATFYNTINVQRISGPSAIAASESVVAKYSLSTNTAPGADTSIAFDTKVEDSHNAFNPATGIFTAPMSGAYTIMSAVQNTTGTQLSLYVLRGAIRHYLGGCSAGANNWASGSTVVRMSAGETLSVKVDAAVTLGGTGGGIHLSNVSIVRSGN